MQEKAFVIKISGRVTGIGFRWSAMDYAEDIPGLKGFIRNSGYGEVEAFIQGSQDAVDQMIAWLRKGPPLARVDSFEIHETRPLANATAFTIEH